MNGVIYSVFINGEGKAKRLSPTFKLNEARAKLKISTNDYFYLNDNIIDKNDEEDFTIQEICDGKKIVIKSKNASKPQLSVDICKKNGDKITSINIESKKLSLNNLRKLLENKIQNSFKFLSTEELPVDYSDESEILIEDILKNNKIFISNESNIDEGVPPPVKIISKKNDISPTPNSNSSKMIFVKLNNTNIDTLNTNIKDNLATLRRKLRSKVNDNDLFIFKGENIDFDRETELKIENILSNETIYMKTKNEEDNYKTPAANKLYNIERNGVTDQIKLSQNLKLDKLRAKLKLKKNELFYFNNKPILINKEKEFTINDIQNERTIEINEEDNDEDDDGGYKPVYTGNNIGKKKLNIKYVIHLNGRVIQTINLPPNEKLNSVRKWLSQNISDNDCFKYNDRFLECDEENIMDINDIAIGNKIYIEKKEKETKKKKKELAKPIDGSYKIKEDGEITIYKYPSIEFNSSELAECKTIMVVGQTGSGKTTLLNSLVNFIVGIQLDDPIRYIIIEENNGMSGDQSKSQTSDVNAYYIKRHGEYPPLRIIDTPGFGDTRGIEFDKKITKLIKNGFETKFDSLNAICFVAQSSNARLTPNQKFIFSEIMNLFGNDVAENFVSMLTFCDGKEPQIIAALKSKDSIFYKILPHLQNPWYLKFNNSAIFATVKDKFTEMFWELGMDSFKIFLQKLLSLPRKSLQLAKEVLKARESIEITIINLRPKLDAGLTLMESYKKQIKAIEMNKDIINKSKNFKIQTTQPDIQKVDLPPGTNTTTCLKCNRTCHEVCQLADNNDKKYCWAINENSGYCNQCPGKCYWDLHKNTPYKIVYKTKQVETTVEELKNKYTNAKSQLSVAQQIINGMEKELKVIEIECLEMQENIKNNLNKLEKIALNTNSHESTEEYLKMMIVNEETEKKEGYLDRIKALKELQNQNEIIKKLHKNQNVIKEFDEFKKDYINKKKQELKKEINVELKEEKNCIIF